MPDALKQYKSKRNFSLTPEPAEGGQASTDELGFVIQKHWARRLHYDLRLELDGTLKSWAVPKGPSYDSADKRMAVQVEDHPLSYAGFEGDIPEKQYGAGKVIVWDKGTWHPLGDPHEGYRNGNLKFELRGHKMQGKWVLVRMKSQGEKQPGWLLIKEKDEFARSSETFSVVDDLPDSVIGLPTPDGAAHANGVQAALPAKLAPQLATLVDKPPAQARDWIFEVKFDGYRLLARVAGPDIRLLTRNGHDWTAKLGPLHQALLALNLPDGWYDGEIVVHDDHGRPDFGLLQQAFDKQGTADIVYFLFDAPYLDGLDLRAVPLESRRAQLKAVLEQAPSERVRFSEEFGNDPAQLLAAACKIGLEGVIGKRRSARYVSRRSSDWVKLKCGHSQEFVIAGYTDPQGARSGVGALLLGYYDEHGVLQYAGNVGSGFSEATLRELKSKLEALETGQSPFPPKTVAGRKHHWVKPTLIAEVNFAEWTHSGSVRHAVFKGLRSDKPPRSIVRERPVQAEPTEPDAPSARLPPDLKVSNAERIIDPVSGASKLDLVRYYALVGPLMMMHLKERPVALVRAPAGVGGQLFFQKHADVAKLPGMRQLDQALDPGHPTMLEVASERGILSAAQWNVLEFHTQNAKARAYHKPDRMVFDLDPGQGILWPAMREAALLMRAFLEELGLPAYLKTSGGKGLHVVVPIKGELGWDQVKEVSQAVVRHMAGTLPDRFAFKSGPRNRVGKIFIDYLRNGQGATTVCAWSARARPGLGISVPLDWDELDAVTAGDQWNVRNVHTRLGQGNAPWDSYARSARTLVRAIKTLGV